MSKSAGPIKTATNVLKTAGALLSASSVLWNSLKENEEITQKAKAAADKVRDALKSRNPKARFDATLAALDSCVDALQNEFSLTDETQAWRKRVASLRIRGELAWGAAQGRKRKDALKGLSQEAGELFNQINARLIELSPSLENVGETEQRTNQIEAAE